MCACYFAFSGFLDAYFKIIFGGCLLFIGINYHEGEHTGYRQYTETGRQGGENKWYQKKTRMAR